MFTENFIIDELLYIVVFIMHIFKLTVILCDNFNYK